MPEEKPEKIHCRRSPGQSYPTREAAQAAILTRRINLSNTGLVAREGTHQVKGCDCGGYHVLTAGQLQRRKRNNMRKLGGTGRRR